jgi:protein-tyrosine phosphatase
MPAVLEWNPTVAAEELRERILATATEGAPVILPGDCGYMVALPIQSPRLELLVRRVEKPVALWVQDSASLRAHGLEIPLALQRLLSRAWPLPLIALLPLDGTREQNHSRPAWWEWVTDRQKRLRIRYPDHPVASAFAETLDVSQWLIADTYLPTVEAALDLMDEMEALGISVGPLPSQGRPSQVCFLSNDWEMVEEGAVSAEELARLLARLIIFVCTGNTCRSPLAEGLAKVLAANRWQCDINDLPRRGLWITSAGLCTGGGWPASAEAIQVAAEYGVDLSRHRSQPLQPWLLAMADEVITMTQRHQQILREQYPGLGPPPRLLCEGTDIEDPLGAGLDVYRTCAARMRKQVEQLLAEWFVS